jgi:hypothetical protein
MAYLTPAQVRSRIPALVNPTTYTDTELTNLISEFEEIADRYLLTSFQTKTATAEQIVRPNQFIQLANRPIVSVSAFTVDGVAGTLTDLTTEKATGLIYGPAWYGADVVTVTYTYGTATAPEVLLRACAEYCRSVAFADRSGQSRDVIAQSFDGSMTRYSTPDWNRGRPTGFLEVDRLLNSLDDYKAPGIA